MMALKVFDTSGSGSPYIAIQAILYANANGASVISNSWSGSGDDLSLKAAIDASPAVVVGAAGNFDPVHLALNNDIMPQYPASFTSVNIISVATTSQNDNLATFSHYCPVSVDLAAPGENIFSTLISGTYGYMSGTSMATPHVSGVAALVKSMNPRLTGIQIKNIILNNADVKPLLVGNISTGGRLNEYRAVQAAYASIISPKANFRASPINGAAALIVAFTDLLTDGPSAWNWSFGDNTSNSTVQNPVHIFQSPGAFRYRCR